MCPARTEPRRASATCAPSACGPHVGRAPPRFHYATINAANISRIEMTKSEAKSTVEEKLRKQQLTKPMTETEMTVFCQAMLRNLELETKGALSEIRGWAESWQATWFR